MTLTEALKQSDYVRRKAWPWWKCLNNEAKEATRVWALLERPFLNGFLFRLAWEDAIADDWEALEQVP